MRDHHRSRVGSVIAALVSLGALVLAGCTSVTDGTGSVASGPQRVKPTTALGDPVTADICTAIGLPALAGLGYTPVFVDTVYPPSCAIRMTRAGTPYFTLNMYADYPGTASTTTGRTTRTESGLTVYVIPYDKTVGDCERDILASGTTLKINVVSRSTTGPPNPTADCAGADAMTARLAQLAATGPAAFPRLPLATPSVSDLDLCEVTRSVDLGRFPAFAGATVTDGGFTTECTLDKAQAYLDFEVAPPGPPEGTRPMTVAGHTLYESTDDTSSLCTWTSVQGTTGGGRVERVGLNTEATDTPNLCVQTGRLLSAILDEAGLR